MDCREKIKQKQKFGCLLTTAVAMAAHRVNTIAIIVLYMIKGLRIAPISLLHFLVDFNTASFQKHNVEYTRHVN